MMSPPASSWQRPYSTSNRRLLRLQGDNHRRIFPRLSIPFPERETTLPLGWQIRSLTLDRAAVASSDVQETNQDDLEENQIVRKDHASSTTRTTKDNRLATTTATAKAPPKEDKTKPPLGKKAPENRAATSRGKKLQASNGVSESHSYRSDSDIVTLESLFENKGGNKQKSKSRNVKGGQQPGKKVTAPKQRHDKTMHRPLPNKESEHSSFIIQQENQRTSSSSSSGSGSDKEKKSDPVTRIHKTLNKQSQKRKQRTSLQTTVSQGPSDVVLRARLENLFDEIAPLAYWNNIIEFIHKLENAKTHKRLEKLVTRTLMGNSDEEEINSNINSNSNSNSNSSIGGEQKAAPRSDRWMIYKIMSFLDLLPLDARPVKTIPSPVQEKAWHLRQTATILRHARDKVFAFKDPKDAMVWSKKHPGPDPLKRQEWHRKQTEKMLQRDARAFAKVLEERLPNHKYFMFVQVFNRYVDGDVYQREDDEDNDSTKRKLGLRYLFNSVEKTLGGHIHLVAPDMSRFFYFDGLEDASGKDDSDPSEGHHVGIIEERTSSLAYKEQKVIEAEKGWEKSRQLFVNKMLALYRREDSFDGDEYSSESMDEEDEEIMADLVTAGLQMQENTRAEETTADSSKQPTKAKTQLKPQVHLIFDAVAVNRYLESEKEYPVHSDTTVFIDNLPIDITETEVMDLYSRCGTLEHVEIFNKRPDLDPGPFTASKLRLMAQKMRKQRASRSHVQQQHGDVVTSKWARPRTPVYGMLSFANEAAAQEAGQDSLRIFGMIVRGHSVRSIRAKEMTRLYIDNLGGSQDDDDSRPPISAMDIEYSLSQLLNPDLYVSLDISSSSHKNSRRVFPTSCEVMFPSFEVACDAFERLRADLDLVKDDELCTINWIRTPLDAEKYWTRERGGVV
jgi:hypothetical protein